MNSLVLTPVIWPNRLRELREAHGRARGRKLLIEEVAAAVDCSLGYLSRVEKGKSRPSEELAQALADYYQVPVEELSTGEPPKPKIGEANILGAYVRKQRKAMGLSLQALTERVSKHLMAPLSESSMRNIEAGHRAFLSGDEITAAVVSVVGLTSLDELRAKAYEAVEQGRLEDILLEFQKDITAAGSEFPIYVDGRGGAQNLPGPAHLSRYVSAQAGEYVVRLDRPVLGPALPAGTFLVAQRNSTPPDEGLAIAWSGDQPKAVRLFLDHEKGLVGLREAPRTQLVVEGGRMRLDRVILTVLP